MAKATAKAGDVVDPGVVDPKELLSQLKRVSARTTELSATTSTMALAQKEFASELTNANSLIVDSATSVEKQKISGTRLARSLGAYSQTLIGTIAIGQNKVQLAKKEYSLAQESTNQAREALTAQSKKTAKTQNEITDSEYLTTQYQREIRAREELIGANQETIASNTSQLDTAAEEKIAIEEKISRIKEANAGLAAQADSSRELETYIRSQISVAQEDITASKDRETALRATEDVQTSRIDAINQEIRQIQGRGEFKGRGKQKEISQEEETLIKTLQTRAQGILASFEETKNNRKAEIAHRQGIESMLPGMQAEASAAADAAATYESAISQNNEGLSKENFKRLDLVESMVKMTNQSNELAAQNETLTNEASEYKSELEALGEKTKKLGKELSDSIDLEDKLQAAIADRLAEETSRKDDVYNQQISLQITTTKDVTRKLSATAKVLNDLVDSVRKTQQQFGIAAGQAAQLKIDNLVSSVQSYASALLSGGKRAAVSAEEIANAQQSFQSEFGGVLTAGAATDIAQQAKEMGVGAGELAKARRVFMTQTMGDTGQAKAAQDKFVGEFTKKGLTSKDAMAAIGQNAELLARNGTRFATSFARAAADAKKIGVDLSKVDQVGDNIIGDFEGFLEKQAELGAMGFNFDSSKLAEVAETGDTGALMEELRSQLASQGKDLTKLRRSEQLALSESFGIPMAELQRLAGPKGKDGSGAATLSPEELQKGANKSLERLVNLGEAAGASLALATTLLTFIAKNSAGRSAPGVASSVVSKLPGVGKLAGVGPRVLARLRDPLGRLGAGGMGPALPRGMAIKNTLGSVRGGIGAAAKGLVSPLVSPLSKVAKVGGSALSGVFGAVDGFRTAKKDGKSTEQAAGSAVVQGGLAAAGTALGAFGGPLGMMVGGFLGNMLGEAINKYLPGVGEVFGKVLSGFASVFKPLKESFNILMKALTPLKEAFMSMFSIFNGPGGETSEFAKILGLVLKEVASIIGSVLMVPLHALIAGLRLLVGGFTLVFNVMSLLGNLIKGVFTGDFSGLEASWNKFKENIVNMFGDMFNMIKAPFSAIGKALDNLIPNWAKNLMGGGSDKSAASTAETPAAEAPGLLSRMGSSISGLFGDDVISRPGYGNRTLVTPQKTVALNNNDNVVAYADDMVSDAVNGIKMLSYGALGAKAAAPMSTGASSMPNNNMDLSKLEAKLDQVVNAIGRMNVEMDGQKVGRILVGRTDSATTVGVMRRG